MKVIINDQFDVEVQIYVDTDGDLVIVHKEGSICLDQYDLKKILKFVNENPEPIR